MLFANCHNHSTFSDGAHTPEKLVTLAKEEGHRAIILTDHDTVKGSFFAQRKARELGLLSLLGCEFSTVGFNTGFHLLGIDFDPENREMRELLARVSRKQTERSRILFERGIESGRMPRGVTWQDVLDSYPNNDYFCNNQVFETMLKKGLYERMDYAKFFMDNFRPKRDEELEIERITDLHTPNIEDVVRIIRNAGGVPIVAHPHAKQKYVDDLVSIGVMGFEVRHPDLRNDGESEEFQRICTERSLYKLGGTDHYCVLGGYMEVMPWHRLPPEVGYTTEEDFMAIYERRLG